MTAAPGMICPTTCVGQYRLFHACFLIVLSEL